MSRRLLSDEVIETIRIRYEGGDVSMYELAEEFGVSSGTIYNYLRGLTSKRGGRLKARFRGENSAAWRGGKFLHEGYVRAHVSSYDSQIVKAMAGKQRYLMEHRVVMAQHLGRALLPSETVHHVNGIRTDNRIENLQLRVGPHGPGSVLTCRVCGSHDIESEAL